MKTSHQFGFYDNKFSHCALSCSLPYRIKYKSICLSPYEQQKLAKERARISALYFELINMQSDSQWTLKLKSINHSPHT